MEEKELEIAKSNRNVPALYRMHRLEDHLFPYEIPNLENRDGLRLSLYLERFRNNVQYFIEGKSIEEIDFKILERLREQTDSEHYMSKDAHADEKTKDVSVTVNERDKHLYLCRHYLISLNENVGLLQNTQVLQACCNYLTKIPFSIKHLQNLKMLILSRNRIRELPDELGCCKSLRELDLSNNLLEYLPNSIASLKSLSILHLSSNKLKSLNSAIGKLQSLKNLYVDNNELTHLPLELLKLPFLTNLLTDGNPLLELVDSRMVEVGSSTMLEECARYVVRNNKRIPRNFSKNLINFMLNIKECSFCGGPFFSHYFEIQAMQEFDNRQYPVEYTLCSRHYDHHSDRLVSLFSSTHANTIPRKLIANSMPTVTEIFEPFCHSEDLLQQIKDKYDGAEDKMPLICLSLYNSHFFKQFSKEKKRCAAIQERNAKRSKNT